MLYWLAYREGSGAMVRACSLLQCRCLLWEFEPSLVQDIKRNIIFLPSQYWDIVSMLCPWARHFTPTCLTRFRCKWASGRTEIAMCTISSMRRNGCRTVWSPWSWNGIYERTGPVTSDKSSDLISDYKPAPLPFITFGSYLNSKMVFTCNIPFRYTIQLRHIHGSMFLIF